MSAPKTKSKTTDASLIRGVQLIVFAPINSDPDDEDNRIYMLCPSSLKVVEVVEKFGSEADDFMNLLGQHKKKSSTQPSEFTDELTSVNEVSDDMIEDNSGSVFLQGKDIKTLETELDEDIVSFASDALGDIFPDDGDEDSVVASASDVDLADALAMLDEEDDDSDLTDFSDFKADDDSLPSL